MRIRHKLLVLLLIFAVVPLLLSIVISHLYFYRSGLHLAEEAERQLSSQAHADLHKLVDGFQRLQERDRRMVETALTLHEGRGAWALDSPSVAGPSAPLAYAAVQRYRPGTVSRQITILETGPSSCYPSHETCVDASDLRQHPWYQTTRRVETLTRTLALDPVNDQPAIIVANPLSEGGRFTGVTALVRPVSAMLAELKLSESWFGASQEMLVALESDAESGLGGLRILAQRAIGATPEWSPQKQQARLLPDSAEENLLLHQLIAEGKGGSLEMSYGGVETHWIFGSASHGEPFALILVPHSQIIAQALAAKAHVVGRTLKGLGISGVLLVCAIGAVFFTAVLASKKVTWPLNQLALAAHRLAGGDYGCRVELETQDEVAELGQIFNQLGPALAERERMASSLALAGDVQQHLLPQRQPVLKGFDIFGGALSCDETGGDYFDFIPLGEGRLALAVGDVAGHGVGAALLMAGARGVLRSHAARQDLKLHALFKAMNDHLYRDTADEKFMTLFYGALDASDQTLCWCSAGHAPSFLYRVRDASVCELGSTGLPLGVIDEAVWEEGAPIVFEAGDILLVGTDGIWEAQNPSGELLGTERLKNLLLSQTEDTAEQIHAAVMALVSRFQMEARQEDDITLTVIKAV